MTPSDLTALVASVRAAEEKIKRVETDYAADGGTTWHEYREAKADFGEACITRVGPLCDAIEELQRDLALARGAMKAQDNREKAAGDKCGVPYAQGGCDWPDEVAERVLELQAELAALRNQSQT